jgi:membrane-bound metal-dependent hydrolase YbcI (DUF457 family)
MSFYNLSALRGGMFAVVVILLLLAGARPNAEVGAIVGLAAYPLIIFVGTFFVARNWPTWFLSKTFRAPISDIYMTCVFVVAMYLCTVTTVEVGFLGGSGRFESKLLSLITYLLIPVQYIVIAVRNRLR